VTPTAAALAAATVLQQRDRCCAGGVTTPAGAFHRTDYWDRLKDRRGLPAWHHTGFAALAWWPLFWRLGLAAACHLPGAVQLLARPR
jgi:hypothetical protein